MPAWAGCSQLLTHSYRYTVYVYYTLFTYQRQSSALLYHPFSFSLISQLIIIRILDYIVHNTPPPPLQLPLAGWVFSFSDFAPLSLTVVWVTHAVQRRPLSLLYVSATHMTWNHQSRTGHRGAHCVKPRCLQFESDRVNKLQEKRSQRKAGVRPTTGGFTCVTCGRTLVSFHTAEHSPSSSSS